MPRMTQKYLKQVTFIDELKAKDIIKKLPNMDEWSFLEENISEWCDEDGFEWRLRCTKFTNSEYSISCSNWKTIIGQKMTKAEKRRETIFKSCFIYLAKEYGTGVKGDIFEGDYVYNYIHV